RAERQREAAVALVAPNDESLRAALEDDLAAVRLLPPLDGREEPGKPGVGQDALRELAVEGPLEALRDGRLPDAVLPVEEPGHAVKVDGALAGHAAKVANGDRVEPPAIALGGTLHRSASSPSIASGCSRSSSRSFSTPLVPSRRKRVHIRPQSATTS